MKATLRNWLGIDQLAELMQRQADQGLKNAELLAESVQRIADLEDAYPGYKQAKEDADKKPESLIAGFLPHSKRKRAWEAEHRKPEKK